VKEEKSGARNNITTVYMLGELSPLLMTPVFVDGAAGPFSPLLH
jgi:hypothetical protein